MLTALGFALVFVLCGAILGRMSSEIERKKALEMAVESALECERWKERATLAERTWKILAEIDDEDCKSENPTL